MPKASAVPEVKYPESDGQPMAESDLHRIQLLEVIERLRSWYADREDVYVSGNLFVYYEEGEPRTCLAPDGFVVLGVPNRLRKVYKSWLEGKLPDVVFEFTSASTEAEDFKKKFYIYQDVWRVKEYFLFDPNGEYLDPQLVGYRRTRGEYVALKQQSGKLKSDVLGITLESEGSRLLLREAATGKLITTPAEDRAAKAEKKAARAEAEVARLKAELDALKRKPSK